MYVTVCAVQCAYTLENENKIKNLKVCSQKKRNITQVPLD